MPSVMAALPNIGVAVCSTPQSLANAQLRSVAQAACTPPVPAPAWHGARGRRMH